MANPKFFNQINRDLRNLTQQAAVDVTEENINLLRQISTQLQQKIECYKQLTYDGFDLLWGKQYDYNQLVGGLCASAPVNAEKYSELDKKIKQLHCDIEALTTLLKNEKPQIKITNYESQLANINTRIHVLEQNGRAIPSLG